MKNNLTHPCVSCPFRSNGAGVKLTKSRIRDLARTVGKGASFLCHKTVHHDDEGDHQPQPREQLCAGALAFTLNVGDEMARTVVQIRMHCDAEKLARLELTRADVHKSTVEWLRNGAIE